MRTDESSSEYEANFYVKSILQDNFGERYSMNLYFLVRIYYNNENDIILYGTGSAPDYMNFR